MVRMPDEQVPPSLQECMDRVQSLVEEGMLMKKACAALQCSQCLESIFAKPFCTFSKDKVPADIKPWLYGATLVALRKPQVGYRPIAVGSASRRLAGKVAVAQAQAPLKQGFAPVQLGVGMSHGCESIVHAERAWCLDCNNHEDVCTLMVDLQNAFNSDSMHGQPTNTTAFPQELHMSAVLSL
eukprot:6035018-Amphidinium_carterae.6